jgi:hypothetical protein
MRWVASGLNLFLFCICLQASAQEQKPITVKGKLVNIMSVGGESHGLGLSWIPRSPLTANDS